MRFSRLKLKWTKPRTKFSEGGPVSQQETEEQTQQESRPFLVIDGVNVFREDLDERGQLLFGRLLRLNTKRVQQVLDLEETEASIEAFSRRIRRNIAGLPEVDEENPPVPTPEPDSDEVTGDET
jgi:hypothetical protein